MSLGGRLFVVVWITGRGVSELPWIAGRSDRVRSTDVAQNGEPARIVQNAGWCCKEKRATRKGPSDKIERRHCPIAANKFAAGEEGRSVKDCDR